MGESFDAIMVETLAHISLLRQLGFTNDQIRTGVSEAPTQYGYVLVEVVANGKQFFTQVGTWSGRPKQFMDKYNAIIAVYNKTGKGRVKWQAKIDRSGTVRDFDTIVAKLRNAGLLGSD